jgi:hypothetical protein
MVADVKGYVIGEPLAIFRRAPGPAKEPVQVSAQHGASVIERKQRIKADALKLSLPGNAAAPAFDGVMRGLRKVPADRFRIIRILIRKKARRWRDQGLECQHQ